MLACLNAARRTVCSMVKQGSRGVRRGDEGIRTMDTTTDRDGRTVDLEQLGEQHVDDVGRRFDGQWVLMRLTECDQYGTPVRGYVVAVGKKRQEERGGRVRAEIR